MAGTIVSADIGGTFTDIVVQDNGIITGYFKVPTTPREPASGLIAGMQKHLGKDPDEIVHATTIATNALLGQYGLELPGVSLLTTEGFRDVIEIGRQNRPGLYDLFFQRPRMIVARDSRHEASERTDSSGRILMEIGLPEIRAIMENILMEGSEAVAVCFINSYLNPENEKKACNLLKEKFSYVSGSYSVAPEQREYERTSTTVVNAALMPIVSKYIRDLQDRLSGHGNPSLSIMASSGGLSSPEDVYERPVQILESGPAAGVIAAAELSRLLGLRNAISFDMGGTTAKAGTVVGGEVSLTSEYEVGGSSHHGRVTRGSGYPVRYPFVDLSEVSAGGGTVIWKDSAGALRIGPVSSGADPGPMCYGKGGREPTITDANLVLGILGESLLGGEMLLDRGAAVEGLSRLGDPFEVAESAISLADLEMARAIRIVTVERGLDPSGFTMIAFGGAGPQHAARIAEELGMTEVVIPPAPGLFSASGLLLSDWKYEERESFPEDPERGFSRLEKSLGTKHPGSVFLRYADCRYEGQGSELTVSVESGSREEIEGAFGKLHLATFGFVLDRDVEITVIRAFAVIQREKPEFSPMAGSELHEAAREAVLNGMKTEIAVLGTSALTGGRQIHGPCSIEGYDTTVFVPEGWTAENGGHGEINMRRGS